VGVAARAAGSNPGVNLPLSALVVARRVTNWWCSLSTKMLQIRPGGLLSSR
jgi:hypothetical protein